MVDPKDWLCSHCYAATISELLNLYKNITYIYESGTPTRSNPLTQPSAATTWLWVCQ